MAILPLFTLALGLFALPPQQGAAIAQPDAPVAAMAEEREGEAAAEKDADVPFEDPFGFGFGFGFLNGSMDEKLETERAAHVQACEQGDAEACGQAGRDYYNPLAKFADPAKARQYYVQSCAMKPSNWCNEAGKLAAYGKGGAKDKDYAVAAFHLACLSGDPRGCSNIAVMKYDGAGVPQDLVAARREWTAICENDQINAACHNLAGMWMKGEGGEPMPEAATAMYEKLCQDKYRSSCKMLEAGKSE